MADFNFYLNRQGVKGSKGEKGETGFAPIVEVAEDTAASYKLRIITDTDTLETPNLRGNAVDDLGGTYMRYDPETQKMYAAAADIASTSSRGEVILASDEAIASLSDIHALTPASLVDNYDALIQSSDGSVVITQDVNNSKIDLSVNLSGIEGDLSGLDSRITGCETAIGNIEGDVTSLQNNKVDKVTGKGLSTNDFTSADKIKLDSSLQPTSVDGTTIVYDSVTGKISSTADLSNCVTLNTNQVISGEKTFTSDNLKVAVTSSSPSHTAAQMDANYYPYYYDDTNSRIGGVILGDNANVQNALARGTMQLVSDNGTIKLATIFNEYNLVGGTNVSIIRNSQTGEYEVVAHDTVYTESDGIDINNANEISVKVDNNTINFNSNGELEVVGGLTPSYVDGSGIRIYTDQTTGDEVIAVNYDSSYGLVTTNSALRVATDGSTIGFNAGGQLTSLVNSVTTDTIQTITGAKDFNNASLTTNDLIILNGSNAKIMANLNNNNRGIIRLTSGDEVEIGDTSSTVNIKGSATRPTYNGSSLALLSDTGSAPSNMVTTNTSQTITGTKTFQDSNLILSSGTYSKFNLTNTYGDNLRPESSTSTGLMHFAYNNYQNVATISSNRASINGATRGLLRILPTTNYNDSSIEGYIMTHNLVDMSYKPYLTVNKITSTGGTVTITDNGINGINIEAAGGSTPTNMVTTDTSQTISGHKVFSDSSTEIKNGLYVTKYGTSQIFMGDDTTYAVPVLTMDDLNDILTFGDTGHYLKIKAYNSVVISNQRGNEFTIGYDTLTYKKEDSTIVDLLALESRIAALEARINGGNA